jgi:hypothetical protein
MAHNVPDARIIRVLSAALISKKMPANFRPLLLHQYSYSALSFCERHPNNEADINIIVGSGDDFRCDFTD